MRILIISNFRLNKSGITVQVVNLSKRLIEESYDIELVSTYGTILNRIKGVMLSFKKAINTDIILGVGCGFYGFFPIAVASIVSYLMSKPILYNFHDGQAQLFLEKSKRIAKFFIGKQKVVVASKYIYDIFKKYSFDSELIYNILDYNSFPGREGNFEWNKKIIWTRSFEKVYQPELALEVARVLTENHNFEFHFYGNGSSYYDLKKKYETSKIVFHGLINRDDLLKEYGKFSILLNTTLSDNLPNTIIEAGFYQLMVVSSKVGGISTTFTDKEILFVEKNDVDSYVESILSIYENESKYDIIRNNLYEKIMQFKWTNVKNKWLKLLNEYEKS